MIVNMLIYYIVCQNEEVACGIDKSQANIIVMLQVAIIHLACREQMYASIVHERLKYLIL